MKNEQHGPPHAADALAAVVSSVTYKPGWRLWLADMDRPTEHYAGSSGLTLCIAADVPDSTKVDGDWIPRDGRTNVEHWFHIPPVSWKRPAWERWVLDCLLLVERHEAMEFFRVDGEAVFFPAHGSGANPYEIARVS